tara:strand:+ start:797 stop:1081 length:285 start_codon:yes stop_codon:yes gene_type:complete
MSGDNLHGEQPNIRYNVQVHHEEEWEKMTLSERLEILSSSINNWESEYLIENKKNLSKQQVELLEGREIKYHEGMIYGEMYNNWKTQKGFQWNK